MKNVHETYWYCNSQACQEKRKDWILRIFSFNDKNSLYLPIIATFHVAIMGRYGVFIILIIIIIIITITIIIIIIIITVIIIIFLRFKVIKDYLNLL